MMRFISAEIHYRRARMAGKVKGWRVYFEVIYRDYEALAALEPIVFKISLN